MPSPSRPRKKCPRCGESYTGGGETCGRCTTSKTDAARRVAEAVKGRIEAGQIHDGPICPYCKIDLDWDNLSTTETELTIYVREKIYFCPKCKCFLGVSSWHTEG